ncbi:MAG TPA: arginine N-succinyltransferase [Myxococcota bacterium]|jgi:arginine N-succinyltransferase|nr:arginine N-succinyltransferase [Myxococcota bacterium]
MDHSASQGPFLLRGAEPRDLDSLVRLAAMLDTVNLPPDETVLSDLVHRSGEAFAGRGPLMERQYLFAVEDLGAQRLVGVSMIFAQHGTRASPHVFFDVLKVEHYHKGIDHLFVHRVLKIGYAHDGPTEIGGLVVDPAYRAHPLRVGRAVAFVRFLYMALHLDRFREEVLAELLPPLRADGSSALWEAVGRHFTGLTYREADRRSRTDKDFIADLFPSDVLYATLLPPEAQEIIGVVGPESRGIHKLLLECGFQYQNRIDPFDGGPHFAATTRAIVAVRGTRSSVLGRAPLPAGDAGDGLALVARERDPAAGASPFRAVIADHRVTSDGVEMDAAAYEALAAPPGGEVSVLPLGPRRPAAAP